MRRIRQVLILFPISFLALVLAFACSPEKKLATQFAKSGLTRHVLLFAPEKIFKTNTKIDILDTLGITDESLFDSVLFANSELIQYVNDSLFLSNYMLGLEKELKVFGFEVFKEDKTGSFLEVDSNSFVIYVAQIEIEEAVTPVRDETIYYETYYYHDHILNAANVYSWFEISEVNEEKDQQVYFTSDMIIDEINGEFTYDIFQGGVKYYYSIDSLEQKDLYEYAYLLGRTYAGYTFDVLLNNYLKKKLPPGILKDNYWRYDPHKDKFFLSTDDRFIPLDE